MSKKQGQQQQQMVGMKIERQGKAPPGAITGPQQIVVPSGGQVDKMQYVYPSPQGLVRLPGGQVTAGRVASKQDGGMHEFGRTQSQVRIFFTTSYFFDVAALRQLR
jgi:hypothetical protein